MNGAVEAVVEGHLVGSTTPYTLGEIVKRVKETDSREVLDQDVSAAIERLVKEGKIKCQVFESLPLTVYFDPNLVLEVTVDIKQRAEPCEAVTPVSSTRTAIRRYPMRPGAGSCRVRMPFQSPARKEGVMSGGRCLLQNVEEDVDCLRRKNEELDAEILSLSKEYSEDELKEHIDMLHQYNEIKDTGQMLLGKLAELKGTTTKAMYDDFSLSFED